MPRNVRKSTATAAEEKVDHPADAFRKRFNAELLPNAVHFGPAVRLREDTARAFYGTSPPDVDAMLSRCRHICPQKTHTPVNEAYSKFRWKLLMLTLAGADPREIAGQLRTWDGDEVDPAEIEYWETKAPNFKQIDRVQVSGMMSVQDAMILALARNFGVTVEDVQRKSTEAASEQAGQADDVEVPLG